MNEMPKTRNKTARRTLLIMVTVFAVPYLLAWFIYFKPGVVDLGTRNNGTLISPMISSEQIHLSRPGGQSVAEAGDSDVWMLLSFGEGVCATDCEKTLFTLQQLRKMVGVEKSRLRRAYVVPAGENYAPIENGLARFEGTELLVADAQRLRWLETQLGIETGELHRHIVIADPKANLVMWYPREMDPKKIFADIEILFGRVKRV